MAKTTKQTPMSKIALEDYIATEAMQAIIIATANKTGNFDHYKCAALSYEIAKAMMAVKNGAQIDITPPKDDEENTIFITGVPDVSIFGQ